MLQHESSEKLVWDIFMMILIIFSSFANPLQIGETKHRPILLQKVVKCDGGFVTMHTQTSTI